MVCSEVVSYVLGSQPTAFSTRSPAIADKPRDACRWIFG